MKIEQVTTRTGGYAHLAVDNAPRTLCGAQVHERGFGYVVLSSYKLSFLPTVCARCRTACTALHAKDVARVRRSAARSREARAALERALADARSDGLTLDELAFAASLSAEGVRQILIRPRR